MTGALGVEPEEIIRLGRTRPDDAGEPFGVSQFALRTSRAANGVSRRHGEVAREHVARPVARPRPRGRADRPRDQRRPRAHLAGAADARAARPPPRRRLAGAPGRPGDLGGRGRHPGRRPVGGAQPAAGGVRRVRPRQEPDGPARPRRAAQLRRGRGAGVRPRGAHDRLRPPAGDLQAPAPARPGRRDVAARCWPTAAPSSSCWPARPIRATTTASGWSSTCSASSGRRRSAAASSTSTTTTSRAPRAWSAAATCGSTCRARRWRRAARAA